MTYGLPTKVQLIEKAHGSNGVPDRVQEAKWYRRKPSERATTSELINQLRRELWAEAINPDHLSDFMSTAPCEEKSDKSPVPLTSSLFLSMN